MRIVLVGAPGSGKGTQGSRLAAHFGVPHVASGDILRRIIATEDSELARAARVIEQGRLVSDETASAIVFRELGMPVAARGFVLDGYPRNTAQAQALESFLSGRGEALDGAVSLDISEAEAVRRLSGRLTCPNCGATYHVVSEPPMKEGVCDVCGHAPLVVRPDDAPGNIVTRMRLYHERTEPLTAFYRGRGLLLPVAAEGAELEVFERILRSLSVTSPRVSGGMIEGLV